MSIRGKTVLITGGADRLGRSIALELASRGAQVAINYRRSSAAAEETRRRAAGFGVRTICAQADVTDPAATAVMVHTVEERLGPIDHLVAAAGVFQRTPLDEVTQDAWDEMMRGNYETFRVPAAILAPAMRHRGGGSIVAFGDVAAVRPWSDYIPYCVAKSRVLHHARDLAVAFAPEVRINCVLPGPVLFPPDYPAEARRKEVDRTLLRRAGQPGDVARAVAFLLEGEYLTGVQLPVDGGRLLV